MAEKQVAPPFKSVERSETGKSGLSTQIPGSVSAQREPEDATPSSTEPLIVEQSANQMSSNTNEYWSSGTVGGLQLGNRSSVARPFGVQAANPANPFTRTDKVEVKIEPQVLFDVPEGTPDWRQVVGFVMEHGKDIQCVRYPNPPRSGEVAGMGKGWSTVIDTMWKGVPVVNGEKCQIQHVKYGWAEWADCV